MAHRIKKLNCYICSNCRVVLKDDATSCQQCGAIFYGFIVEDNLRKIFNKLSILMQKPPDY